MRSTGILFQRVRNDNRDMLAIEVDFPVLRQRCLHGLLRAAVDAQLPHIVWRDDGEHARHRVCGRKLEAGDGARPDRALHQHYLHDIRHRKLRGITCTAGRLQPAIAFARKAVEFGDRYPPRGTTGPTQLEHGISPACSRSASSSEVRGSTDSGTLLSLIRSAMSMRCSADGAADDLTGRGVIGMAEQRAHGEPAGGGAQYPAACIVW
jgi:hypothetical protein